MLGWGTTGGISSSEAWKGWTMKLVTWNCNGGFISKKKNKALLDLDPDIAVVQECSRRDAVAAAGEAYQVLWFGDPQQLRGLAIFHKHAWKIEPKAEPTHNWIVACNVSGPAEFLLVAVWSCPASTGEGKYIKLIRDSFDKNKDWFNDSPIVVAGDFNSNPQWDKPPHNHHASMVNDLAQRGLVSVYHSQTSENDAETPTFYMQRNGQKPFHIDYIFLTEGWIKQISKFEIGSFATWRQHSDHMPLAVEIDHRDIALDNAFGIRADRNIDGLEYQLQIRAEWDDRE